MSEEEICIQCAKPVKVQIMKGTGICSELCRKERDGEKDRPRSQADAGITNLLRNDKGMNLNGIR